MSNVLCVHLVLLYLFRFDFVTFLYMFRLCLDFFREHFFLHLQCVISVPIFLVILMCTYNTLLFLFYIDKTWIYLDCLKGLHIQFLTILILLLNQLDVNNSPYIVWTESFTNRFRFIIILDFTILVSIFQT